MSRVGTYTTDHPHARIGLLGTALALLLPLALLFGAADASAAVLVGDATIATAKDTDGAGAAEAFKTVAAASGSVDTLNVYLDASSKSTKVVIGLYADSAGHPGTMLA